VKIGVLLYHNFCGVKLRDASLGSSFFFGAIAMHDYTQGTQEE
jgi:hypothetical protein